MLLKWDQNTMQEFILQGGEGELAKSMGENFLVALAIDLQENWSNGKGVKQIVRDKKLLSWPGRCENWWDFNDHESMIHDIGDRTRKRYYLIWDKNINSGDQGRRDMHQQMQNGAMISKCIIWWCAWRIDFGPILLRPI